MPTDWSVQLKVIVLASDFAHRGELARELQSSPQLLSTDTVAELSEFRECLTQHHYDMAVIALDSTEERLPACLLRYPDLPVLVIVPSRKVGPVEPWLQQGANDVVSRHREGKLRHALKRILEHCVIRAQLRIANRKLISQHKLHRILLDTHAEALLLWQGGQVLEANACLASLVGCHTQTGKTQGTDWQRWLSAQSFADLHHQSRPTHGDVVITSTFGQRYSAHSECLILDRGTAQLIRINPTPIDDAAHHDEQQDSVTGVLRREHFINTLSHWLHSSTLSRYTVVQITIDEPDALPGSGRANSTLQELMAYRVANLLQQQFEDDMMIGRTGPAALTLVFRKPVEQSRNLAVQVRQCLGTVGGLVDDPTHIRVKTLTLAPTALAADEVLLRLEQHPLMTRKARRHVIPVLTPVSTFGA